MKCVGKVVLEVAPPSSHRRVYRALPAMKYVEKVVLEMVPPSSLGGPTRVSRKVVLS